MLTVNSSWQKKMTINRNPGCVESAEGNCFFCRQSTETMQELRQLSKGYLFFSVQSKHLSITLQIAKENIVRSLVVLNDCSGIFDGLLIKNPRILTIQKVNRLIRFSEFNFKFVRNTFPNFYFFLVIFISLSSMRPKNLII